MSYTFVGGIPVVQFRPSGDQDWARQSACAKDGVGPMFPHEQDTDGIEYAKSICNGCSVRLFCLEEALDRNESFGIWGGLTTNERRALKKREVREAAKEAARVKSEAAALSMLAEASGLTVEDAA